MSLDRKLRTQRDFLLDSLADALEDSAKLRDTLASAEKGREEAHEELRKVFGVLSQYSVFFGVSEPTNHALAASMWARLQEERTRANAAADELSRIFEAVEAYAREFGTAGKTNHEMVAGMLESLRRASSDLSALRANANVHAWRRDAEYAKHWVAICERLGICLEADGHASEPGPFEDVARHVDELKRIAGMWQDAEAAKEVAEEAEQATESIEEIREALGADRGESTLGARRRLDLRLEPERQASAWGIDEIRKALGAVEGETTVAAARRLKAFEVAMSGTGPATPEAMRSELLRDGAISRVALANAMGSFDTTWSTRRLFEEIRDCRTMLERMIGPLASKTPGLLQPLGIVERGAIKAAEEARIAREDLEKYRANNPDNRESAKGWLRPVEADQVRRYLAALLPGDTAYEDHPTLIDLAVAVGKHYAPGGPDPVASERERILQKICRDGLGLDEVRRTDQVVEVLLDARRMLGSALSMTATPSFVEGMSELSEAVARIRSSLEIALGSGAPWSGTTTGLADAVRERFIMAKKAVRGAWADLDPVVSALVRGSAA